jgi:hypothetical protein
MVAKRIERDQGMGPTIRLGLQTTQISSAISGSAMASSHAPFPKRTATSICWAAKFNGPSLETRFSMISGCCS